jgi:hypothetical protein
MYEVRRTICKKLIISVLRNKVVSFIVSQCLRCGLFLFQLNWDKNKPFLGFSPFYVQQFYSLFKILEL